MSRRTKAPFTLREAFLVASWFGLAGGLVQGATHYALQEQGFLHWRTSLVPVSSEILWISPAFDLGLYLLTAGVLAGLARLAPRRPWRALAFLSFAFATCLGWMWLVLSGRMRAFAVAILAVGVATVATTWFASNSDAAMRGMRKTLPWAVLVGVLALLATEGGLRIAEAQAAAKLPGAQAGSPNILIIVVDTLRADHLAAYGYRRATSPHMDRLAQQGVLFERAYAPSSWAIPAHASLLTGRFLFEHRAEEDRLDNRLPTLPEALESRGYRTGAFSANTFYFCRRAGFGRGFLRFDDDFYSVADRAWRTVLGRVLDMYLLRPLGMKDVPARRSAADVNTALLDWLGHGDGRPFFAMLNYYDVHDPYLPPREYARNFLGEKEPAAVLNWVQQRRDPWLTPEQLQEEVDAYDGGILYADTQIGALRSELEKRGLLQNTILVVTSDHGEAFGEHQVYLHRNSLYMEEIHVPLIFSWPERLPPGTRIQTPVSNAYLAATLLDLIGAREEARFPGPSLAQLWRDPQLGGQWPMPLAEMKDFGPASPRALAYDGGMKSLISGDWHFLLHEARGSMLFYLREDPLEKQNLAATPEGRRLCEEFISRLEKVLRGDRTALVGPIGGVPASPERTRGMN